MCGYHVSTGKPRALFNCGPGDGEEAPPCCKLYALAVSLNCVGVRILLKEGNVVHDLVEVDMAKVACPPPPPTVPGKGQAKEHSCALWPSR